MTIFARADCRVSSKNCVFHVNQNGTVKTSIVWADGKQSVYVNTYNSGLALVMKMLKENDYVEVEGVCSLFANKAGTRNTAYPGISIAATSIKYQDVVEYTSDTDMYPARVLLLYQHIFNEFPDKRVVEASCSKDMIKKKIDEYGALCKPPQLSSSIKLDQLAAKKRVEEAEKAKVGTMSDTFQKKLKEGQPPP
ncbi:hypothetical protein MAM1_1259c11541 [Mucor ambiguus]|uniref:Uncharacterized protein n=1 Tax=Mucor ambiguus TaxID=91626 RepID=A0A0C9LZE1_9FUNG|nr:hypothetical protein MAM1_1259c11541 [Mucor ambiguus]